MTHERTLEAAAERFGALHADFDKAIRDRAREPKEVVAWFHERGLCVDARQHPIIGGEVLVEPVEALS